MTYLELLAQSSGSQMMLILVICLVVIGLGMIIFFFSRYKKCPSDKILVIYGKNGGQSSKCTHGGTAFVWPVIQAFEYLDLTPIPIDIPLEGALDKEGNRVNAPSTFTVGISTDPSIMSNAAKRLLGLQLKQIRDLAKDIIFGQMRLVIASLDIETINSDRDLLINKISEYVQNELSKVGLRLINVNIKDITDNSGYLTALGKWISAGKPEVTEDLSSPIEAEQRNINSTPLTSCEQWHVESSEIQVWDLEDEPIRRASVELKVLYGSTFIGTTDDEGIVKLA
jgi:flotillin